MRFIDYLRLNPVCFDPETGNLDFDATPYIEGTTVFDVGEIAEKLIESGTEMDGEGLTTHLTDEGREQLKIRPTGELVTDQVVGIIPPFENCFFEYPVMKHGDRALDCGVHVFSMPKDWIEETFPDQGFHFAFYTTVFFRFAFNGQSVAARETTAMFASDREGRLCCLEALACLPKGADPSLPKNRPQFTPLLVVLGALTMLNCRLLKSTLSPEVAKSRQQHRSEARHPDRALPPLVRYYVLSIDPERMPANGASRSGGWEVAWHRVRGFLRHLKSGKIVPVRPHTRGNPLKGVVLKDYEVRGKAA